MTIELSEELRRRAAIHAALADPARLSVVDQLLVGDASPSTLQERLSIPSNLMAHHVRVLARAGLIRRTRSEGDRRRTYLSLVPAVLEQLTPATSRAAARVVFVCTRNSARSRLAAALWRQYSDVPATSAGTEPAERVHPGAVAVAQRHELALRTSAPQKVTDVLRRDDLVVTVCDHAHEELGTDLPRVHWSVADPARLGTDEAFERALDELTARVVRVAPTVHRAPRGPSARSRARAG
ncbi:helix-turn-helix domain-containing protein [Actinophytocola glycyrrhizae]|uniref:Helix-turn-helix domain-containing protein n=1 Tax=Actinophytocola glycyrrhizae TaxID=2044873 RepID=A0ABV9S9P6_9PSEU